nr:MAG TPA: hypothetical protein [Caudoviricetes sp.]
MGLDNNSITWDGIRLVLRKVKNHNSRPHNRQVSNTIILICRSLLEIACSFLLILRLFTSHIYSI